MLTDGEWHSLAQVKADLAAKVPPGRALRTYETKAQYRNTKHGPRKNPELTDQEKIDSGRTALVNNAVHSMSKRYIDLRGDGLIGEREIRLRPGVTLPGKVGVAPAGPEPATGHGDRFDAEGGPGEEYTADDVRALIIDAVQPLIDEAIHEFGIGLRTYLDNNFTQLDILIRRTLSQSKRDGGQQSHERRN